MLVKERGLRYAEQMPDIYGELGLPVALQFKLSGRLDGLDRNCLYHTREHVAMVCRATQLLSERMGVEEQDCWLVGIAALYHDIGYPPGSNHEFRSALAAVGDLKLFGFAESEYVRIAKLILATEGEFDVRGAWVTSPGGDVLKQIICDADMSVLGHESFMERSDLLRQELGFEDVKGWRERQRLLMMFHRWHTEAAEQLWGLGREKNLELLKAELAKYS